MILTKEILLFQKRAGIITEVEYKEKIKKKLNALKSKNPNFKMNGFINLNMQTVTYVLSMKY